MAEGWGRHFKSDRFDFFSAGTKKHGLNPMAVRVMNEAGVDISSHVSKTTEDLDGHEFTYVVTVCSDAHETCPYFSGQGKIVHHGFDDPPRLTKNMTDEGQILEVYRRVRDEIRDFVLKIEQELEKQ